MRKILLRQIFGIGLVIILSACSPMQLYEGSTLPRQQVSILKARVSWLAVTDSSVEIRKIDGVKIKRFTQSVALLPGIHEIEVVCYWQHDEDLIPNYRNLNLSLYAGKSYQFYSVQRSTGCDVNVEVSVE